MGKTTVYPKLKLRFTCIKLGPLGSAAGSELRDIFVVNTNRSHVSNCLLLLGIAYTIGF
jgi:hypothetical protein